MSLNFGLEEIFRAYKDAAKPTGSKKLSQDATQSVVASNPLARADDQGRVIVDIYLDGAASIDEVAKTSKPPAARSSPAWTGTRTARSPCGCRWTRPPKSGA